MHDVSSLIIIISGSLASLSSTSFASDGHGRLGAWAGSARAGLCEHLGRCEGSEYSYWPFEEASGGGGGRGGGIYSVVDSHV